LTISERIWHLTRAFSAREIKGFGRHLDLPPARFYQEPIPSGPNKGHFLSREEIDSLLTWYYEARGWDENGIPKKETLERAGLADVAEDREIERSEVRGQRSEVRDQRSEVRGQRSEIGNDSF
jgi:aldehyde:ferredoxin oxidoreductase